MLFVLFLPFGALELIYVSGTLFFISAVFFFLACQIKEKENKKRVGGDEERKREKHYEVFRFCKGIEVRLLLRTEVNTSCG